MKKNLYVAYFIDRKNPMHASLTSEPKAFISELESISANFNGKRIIERVTDYSQLESFVKKIDKQNYGTFIFYFSGNGHKEDELVKKEIELKTNSVDFDISLDIGTCIKNGTLLGLFDIPQFNKITFNFILEACHTGEFIKEAKMRTNVPLLVLSATDDDGEINSSYLTNFIRIVISGVSKRFLNLERFSILFNAWFAQSGKNCKPRFYYNHRLSPKSILFN